MGCLPERGHFVLGELHLAPPPILLYRLALLQCLIVELMHFIPCRQDSICLSLRAPNMTIIKILDILLEKK